MGLLRDIQHSLMDEKARMGAVLLKLRFLADRLGSEVLEDWVKHELNGYGSEPGIPDYRCTSIIYTGTFTDGYKTLSNVSVAPHLIKKHAGESWVDYQIRDSLPLIETMIARTSTKDHFSIDTGNLKLLIHDKIYKGMTCIDIHAQIDVSAFERIVIAVRAKLLDLTLDLEKRVPVSSLIELGEDSKVSANDKANVTMLTQNIFHAPVNNIANSGSASPVSVSVTVGDTDSLKRALIERGLNEEEANELSRIAGNEKPTGDQQPFGRRAKSWLKKRLASGVDGVLKIGGRVAEDDIAELFQKFYDRFM